MDTDTTIEELLESMRMMGDVSLENRKKCEDFECFVFCNLGQCFLVKICFYIIQI